MSAISPVARWALALAILSLSSYDVDCSGWKGCPPNVPVITFTFSLIHHLIIVQVGTSAHLAPRPKPPGVQFVQWHLAWLCGGPQLWHWQSHLGKGLNNQLISSFVTFTFSALTLAKPSWQRFYQFALLSLSLSHLWHGKAILAKVDIIFSWCHFHFLTTLLLHCPSFDIGKAIVAKVWLICSVTFTFSALTLAKPCWKNLTLFSHDATFTF